MSEFWVMIIVIILNLAMVVALSLVFTALAEACDTEIDSRLKAGMIITAVAVSLIPYFNILTLIFWFMATVLCIAVYFDSV